MELLCNFYALRFLSICPFPVAKSSSDTKLDFSGVTFLEDEPAVEGEEDLLNALNADSELNINNGGNDKIQAIIEHAANGDESFDDIMNEWNQRNQAL